MTTTECAANSVALNDTNDHQAPDPPASEERASKSLKGLFVGFAATVTVGLGLTIWYLGSRMVAADSPAPPIAAPPIAAPVSAAPSRAVAPDVPPPAPPPAFYLEMPALGPKQDDAFVRSLEARGFHAESSDTRIRIGPFATSIDMQQAQRNLEADGVLALATSH